MRLLARYSVAALGMAALLLTLTGHNAHANPLYRWTDANGVVHFSDRPADPTVPVKKPPVAVTVQPSTAPYSNEAEERWHDALRTHGVQIRSIVIKRQPATHSKPTGR